MKRRTFFLGMGSAAAQQAPSKYEPAWESLRRHTVPAWFEDAKLGIFIHWGLYSVPAWATPTGELGKVDRSKWFQNNPYAEWYLNTLRLKNTPTAEYHAKTYGADFDYYRFAEMFQLEIRKWNPAEMARLFREAGARYVVLTSKHHDGFTLWPSSVENPKRPGQKLAAGRDIVGELTQAVRAAGMKMGLYYSGGLDWTFEARPIATSAEVRGTVPQTGEYARYVDAHWRELIGRYEPSVLWNDISYPKLAKTAELFAGYYNRFPDGVINNRFGVEHSDFTTPEYARYDKITEKKWESCRGLGFSFGYNRVEGPEHVIASDKLIAMLVDIVSKNGNLLLNVGPRADGSISEIQSDRLAALGRWMKAYGEGIHGTRPWIRPSAVTTDGVEVRFTKKQNTLFAFLLEQPKPASITMPNLTGARGMRVAWIGSKRDLAWKQRGLNLVIEAGKPPMAEFAAGLRMTPAPAWSE